MPNRPARIRSARSASPPSRIRAAAATAGPTGLPRTVAGATRARGSRRIRLTFPESGAVLASRRPSSMAHDSGVGTAVPSRRNVTTRTVPCPRSPAKRDACATSTRRAEECRTRSSAQYTGVQRRTATAAPVPAPPLARRAVALTLA